jgi:hypothetical protein
MLPCIPIIILAANSPRKKVARVAAHVVASEIYSGDGSKENVTVRPIVNPCLGRIAWAVG